MRTLILATTLFLAALAPAAPAAAAETRLTAADIREIAGREMLWCDGYQAATDDCAVITLIRLLPDGKLAETSTILLSERPNMQVYIADTNALDGDRMCSKVVAEETRFSFTLDGQPAPKETGDFLRLMLASQLEELDGKTLCQSFFRGDDPNVIREEITVDGERRTDLESVYHLRDGGAPLKLRPQTSGNQEQQVHT